MPDTDRPFTLTPCEVPDPPTSSLWGNQLRWMICVMNPDDSSLHFVASVLSYILKNGGLTDRQSAGANKVLTRVRLDHSAGVLDCQIFADDREPARALENMTPEGNA